MVSRWALLGTRYLRRGDDALAAAPFLPRQRLPAAFREHTARQCRTGPRPGVPPQLASRSIANDLTALQKVSGLAAEERHWMPITWLGRSLRRYREYRRPGPRAISFTPQEDLNHLEFLAFRDGRVIEATAPSSQID